MYIYMDYLAGDLIINLSDFGNEYKNLEVELFKGDLHIWSAVDTITDIIYIFINIYINK